MSEVAENADEFRNRMLLRREEARRAVLARGWSSTLAGEAAEAASSAFEPWIERLERLIVERTNCGEDMSVLAETLAAYAYTRSFREADVEHCPETGGVCINTGCGIRVRIVQGPMPKGRMF